MNTDARVRCGCGRPVPPQHAAHGVIDCAEHDARDSAPTPAAGCPLTDVTSTGGVPPQVSPFPGGCQLCGGDRFLFHLVEGAVELDGPCPACQECAA